MKKCRLSLIIVFLLYSFNDRFVSAGANFGTNSMFRGSRYADIENPRALTNDLTGDILVKGFNNIIVLSENGEDKESATILNSEGFGLNHGIAFSDNFLYASSATNVYRWPYKSGSRSLIQSNPQIVVSNMPFGGYSTRSLVIDSQNKFLYVTIGSNANVDVDNTRSLIMRFNLTGIPGEGFSFDKGQIVATGLRNVVGIGFDTQDNLWGVDNGVLNLPGLSHDDNPADELNKIITNGSSQIYNFGYPYCFTSGKLLSSEQFAHPIFKSEYNDTWCQTIGNNEIPKLALPAHNAPLGINFYDGRGCDSVAGSFPCTAKGDAFISFHGSKNRDVPDGYYVGWVPFKNGGPVGTIIPVIYEPNVVGCQQCFRPVDSIFTKKGHLIVSTDETNELFVVTYVNSMEKSAASAAFINFSVMLTSIFLLALNYV